MSQTKDRARCPHCQEWVGYDVKEVLSTAAHLDDRHLVEYSRLIASCQNCGGVIPSIQEVVVENLKRLRAVIDN